MSLNVLCRARHMLQRALVKVCVSARLMANRQPQSLTIPHAIPRA